MLADGINFGFYNTPTSALDLDDLRQELGYESWNLFGISYGTRLALAAMRDTPKGIRSVIIDSVWPPNAPLADDLADGLVKEPGYSSGLQFAVNCYEWIPRITPEMIQADRTADAHKHHHLARCVDSALCGSTKKRDTGSRK